VTYCIDTSSIIDAGERYYPPDVFPAFWERLDGLVVAGRLKAPDTLIDELKKKGDEWRDWIYQRQARMIVPIDDAILAAMPRVMAVYIRQDVDITRVTGDPFFNATSVVHGLTPITSEVPPRVWASAGATRRLGHLSVRASRGPLTDRDTPGAARSSWRCAPSRQSRWRRALWRPRSAIETRNCRASQ
jgi:Domain of unknown function (DUF4411)